MEFNAFGIGFTNHASPGDDQVSIQCYNGPADAEHWFRFDDFRISKLAE